jgi:hypothetical protein
MKTQKNDKKNTKSPLVLNFNSKNTLQLLQFKIQTHFKTYILKHSTRQVTKNRNNIDCFS